MPNMGKKKTDAADQSQKVQATDRNKEDRHKEPVLGLRLSGRLVDLVRELAGEHRRTLTTEVTIALEEYLKKHGKWPPPDAG